MGKGARKQCSIKQKIQGFLLVHAKAFNGFQVVHFNHLDFATLSCQS